MRPFETHRGLVAPLLQANIDTDQIIPARYLHRPREAGFGDVLFADLRRDEDGVPNTSFPLETPRYAGASILVAGDNFGCGSSREHAVWAVVDAGLRVVIAPSFGDIFANNALRNGLLTVTLAPEEVAEIAAAAEGGNGLELTVDLPEQHISAGQQRYGFAIDPYRKQALLEGLSETAMTLRLSKEIAGFEARHAEQSPWLQRLPDS